MNVRDAFFDEIYQMVQQGKDIVIVSADLGAPSLDKFRLDFPHRFINVGIAEQNLLTVAAGLALAGKYVIAFGLNPFPVTRAYDQIRNFMGNLKIPMTVAALNTGTCSAECGYTHMPMEDFAMVRMLPTVRMVNPSDTTIAKMTARKLVLGDEPVFIRFDKFITDSLYEESVLDFQKGFVVARKSSDFAIVTTGNMVSAAKAVSCSLSGLTVRPTVIDCFAFPMDQQKLAEELSAYRYVITLEDNIRPAGLGSLVLEVLSDGQLYRPIKRLGISLKVWNGRIMNREQVYHELGYDSAQLSRTVEKNFEELMHHEG